MKAILSFCPGRDQIRFSPVAGIDFVESSGGEEGRTEIKACFSPTLNILYRLTGALGAYKPRRPHESEQSRESDTDFIDILTQEDCLFWFRQRILQYGASARVLDPPWLAAQIAHTLKEAYANYC